jgi:hypothetical protein
MALANVEMQGVQISDVDVTDFTQLTTTSRRLRIGTGGKVEVISEQGPSSAIVRVVPKLSSSTVAFSPLLVKIEEEPV